MHLSCCLISCWNTPFSINHTKLHGSCSLIAKWNVRKDGCGGWKHGHLRAWDNDAIKTVALIYMYIGTYNIGKTMPMVLALRDVILKQVFMYSRATCIRIMCNSIIMLIESKCFMLIAWVYVYMPHFIYMHISHCILFEYAFTNIHISIMPYWHCDPEDSRISHGAHKPASGVVSGGSGCTYNGGRGWFKRIKLMMCYN